MSYAVRSLELLRNEIPRKCGEDEGLQSLNSSVFCTSRSILMWQRIAGPALLSSSGWLRPAHSWHCCRTHICTRGRSFSHRSHTFSDCRRQLYSRKSAGPLPPISCHALTDEVRNAVPVPHTICHVPTNCRGVRQAHLWSNSRIDQRWSALRHCSTCNNI